MIKEYQITNFKPFAESAVIPVRPITLIFGPNSSGKSSILQSLTMLKQTTEEGGKETPLLPKGSLADLGNFREFIHRHDDTRKFSFKVTIPIKDSTEKDKRVQEFLDSIISFETVGLGITFSDLKMGDLTITQFETFVGDNPEPLFTYEMEQPDKEIDKGRFFTRYPYIAKLKDFNEEHEYWLKHQSLFDKPASEAHFDFSHYLIEGVHDDSAEEFISPKERKSISLIPFYTSRMFREILRRFVYVGHLRGFPERYYSYTGNKNRYVGKTGEFVADILFSDPEILSRVNEQFDHLKIGYELRVANLTDQASEIHDLRTLRLKEKSTGTYMGFTDVGFGISQLLPIVVQSMVSERHMLLIEQPELHLHPALQAEMGDIFIRSALGENKNTFIIETHSEHLILRLLRRIRETTEGELPEDIPPIKPDDLSLLYVKPDEKGASVIHIPATEDGEFERFWPGGFFPERSKELF
ncbi:DUF3696 domain-containing protein [Desulfobacterales bacterium HSG2]|nr:DUF3696 domain-containing protein [Desulfobacterales bacterium HSG2]